jgi:hypothetical protein
MMHVGTPWNRKPMTLVEAVTIAGINGRLYQWCNPFTSFSIRDAERGPVGSPFTFKTRGKSRRKKSNSAEVTIIRPAIGRAGW